MRFSMLYSEEQILSFKSCLVFYAGDSLNNFWVRLAEDFERTTGIFIKSHMSVIEFKRKLDGEIQL